uniref:Ion transport domain-containing protein n=1 Tax=Panagrolaimus sp. JU765 TaxID=591449 RepID=A0AC34R8E4_9BILA
MDSKKSLFGKLPENLLEKRGSNYTQVFFIDEQTSIHEKLSYRQKIKHFRIKVYNFLEKPRGTINFLYHLGIFLYIVVVHSLSVPGHKKWTMDLTFYMEISLAIYFTTEFFIRIWSIGADAKYAGFDGFVRYMKRFTSIIDIVIISVTFLIIFAHNGEVEPKTLEKIQFLQILRLLHIDRQLTTWKMIKKMIVRSFEELVTLYWISGLVFVFLAYCVYEIETYHEAKQKAENVTVQPTFKNYGESFWFSIITVLTVGFGDIVPKHWFSKFTVGILCLLGVCLFSAASSLVGVGLSLMVENEAKIQQETKVRNLAARLIQAWYRFYLISDDNRFADFRKFRKYCSDLHHVEERIKLARALAKKAAIKRQIKPKIFSQYSMSFKRRGSDPEKHSDFYSNAATELGMTTLIQNSAFLNVNRNRSFKIQDLLSDKPKTLSPRKLSAFVSSGELPPIPPNLARRSSSGAVQPSRVLQVGVPSTRRAMFFQHLQSLSSAPLGVSMLHPQQSKEPDPSIISYSEASTGSVDFSDEEKLLDYYYDPYKGDTASVGRRSQDTTISALDDDAINRYRQILRMLHYFIFQITKKKFHRARKPYELMDAESELAEMEYQRMQKIKELELRIQATIGKPTISPFEMDEGDGGKKRNIEDRIELCEISLRKLEMKMQIVENLGNQILETFQQKTLNHHHHENQNQRERFVSTGHDNRETETKDEIKTKDEQKRRVLFKDKSFG